MPIAPIKFRPGINTIFTPTLNEGGWSDSNLIRFVGGLPQKIGGWVKYWPFSVASAIRAMVDWQDFNAVNHLGVGAEETLGVITNGALSDITPQTFTSDFTPDFSTTSSSATVEIDDPNLTAPVTTYDAVFFSTPVSIGGRILSGLYPITLVTGGTSYEITASADATATEANAGTVPAFDTTSGSAAVDVTLADHGLTTSGRITFPIPTSVGGLTIEGTYQVVDVASADVFTITASAAASSTATADMNGGDAQLLYYIALGPAPVGAGYGLGTYGTGTYGLGATSSVQTGTPITTDDWTLDVWGQTLLACPDGGGIYAWDPDGGFTTSQVISTDKAPIFNAGIFVAQPAQILVAYGSTTQAVADTIGVYQDPMLVRWSDQDDYTDWSISTTDQVGSVRLSRGSRIVGGIQGPNQALLWTDAGVWSMTYVGQPLVFTFQEIGSGCGMIAKHAAAVLQEKVFWFGLNNFYMLAGGAPEPIPCTVWDNVFQDLDTTNQDKCWAWPVATFNEVWFFYPSLQDDTGECSRYAKLNINEKAWDIGILARSAGIDQSVLDYPVAATTAGLIYEHENGNNADGQPISSYVESAYVMIAEGNDCMFVDQVRPDMKYGFYGQDQDANMTITITALNDMTGQEMTSGALAYDESTTYFSPRIRGHRTKYRIASDDLGSWWRLGLMRYRAAKDGKQ